jgi:hypothetical protein
MDTEVLRVLRTTGSCPHPCQYQHRTRDAMISLHFHHMAVLIGSDGVRTSYSTRKNNFVWYTYISVSKTTYYPVSLFPHYRFRQYTANSISTLLWLYGPLLGHGSFFSFFIYTQSAGLFGTRNKPVSRPLPTHRTTQTQNKRTQTSMPRVGFEPTTPVFERAKTVHALDRAAT